MKNIEFYLRREDGKTFAFFEKNEFDLGKVEKINIYQKFAEIELVYEDFDELEYSIENLDMKNFLDSVSSNFEKINYTYPEDFTYTDSLRITLNENYNFRFLNGDE